MSRAVEKQRVPLFREHLPLDERGRVAIPIARAAVRRPAPKIVGSANVLPLDRRVAQQHPELTRGRQGRVDLPHDTE